MGWKLSQPLGIRVFTKLEKKNQHKCKKCGEILELGKTYMYNKHNNYEGQSCRWYHLECYMKLYY